MGSGSYKRELSFLHFLKNNLKPTINHLPVVGFFIFYILGVNTHKVNTTHLLR